MEKDPVRYNTIRKKNKPILVQIDTLKKKWDIKMHEFLSNEEAEEMGRQIEGWSKELKEGVQNLTEAINKRKEAERKQEALEEKYQNLKTRYTLIKGEGERWTQSQN